MTPADKSRLARKIALDVGFDRAGVVAAERVAQADYYRRWLAAGRHGSMAYLARNVEARAEPARLLDGARSIICVALNYRWDEPPDCSRSSPPSPIANDPASHASPRGRVAQYARGADYHVVLRRMLHELAGGLRSAVGEDFAYRAFVDTGPLLERALAQAAGLGWIGKNTLLMHAELGSFLFLGELLTTLEMEPDRPLPDHCGNCRRCLDACPTQAFPAPYQLDASRCIAYFNIEHRKDVPEEFHSAMGDWVFGCDVCQDVCPFNARPALSANVDLAAERVPKRPDLIGLLEMTSGDYRRLTRGAAVGRASRSTWRRSAAIALGNRADPDRGALDALRRAAQDDDPHVRAAAGMALARHTRSQRSPTG